MYYKYIILWTFLVWFLNTALIFLVDMLKSARANNNL